MAFAGIRIKFGVLVFWALAVVSLTGFAQENPEELERNPLSVAAEIEAEKTGNGAVLDAIFGNGSEARAGLEEGDLLLSWERPIRLPDFPQARTGVMFTPEDIDFVQENVVPEGPVTLYGSRLGQPMIWTMTEGPAAAMFRPPMSNPMYNLHQNLVERVHEKEPQAARLALEQLLQAMKDRPQWHPWAYTTYAEGAGYYLGKEESLWACEKLEKTFARDSYLLSTLYFNQAQMLAKLRLKEQTLAAYQKAVDAALLNEQPLSAANAYNEMAIINARFSRGQEAESFFIKALNLKEQVVPHSLSTAKGTHNLAVMVDQNGDPRRAEKMFLQALELKKNHNPIGSGIFGTYLRLGRVMRQQGKMVQAREVLEQGLALVQKSAPKSWSHYELIGGLGIVAMNSGNYSQASAYFLEALDMVLNDLDSPDDSAMTLGNLGLVANKRGDLSQAKGYHERALAIFRKKGMKVDIAIELLSLSQVTISEGNPEQALVYLAETQDLLADTYPRGQEFADSVVLKGSAQLAMKNFDEAYREFIDAQNRLQALNNQSMLAGVQGDLAEVLMAQGQPEKAEPLARSGVEKLKELLPMSSELAKGYYQLAQVLVAQGKGKEAMVQLEAALKALEGQLEMLGASEEGQALFLDWNQGIYEMYLHLQVEANNPVGALGVFERGRAQGFLQMVSQRPWAFAQNLPENLKNKRTQLSLRQDKLLGELSVLQADDTSRQQDLRAQLSTLQDDRVRLAEEILKAAPRLRLLQTDSPLEPAALLARLPKGMAVLAFTCLEKETMVLVKKPGENGLTVARLPFGQQALAEKVKRVRGQLANKQKVEMDLKNLGEILIGPVWAQIKNAESLLILPDGPLHALPFSALLVSEGEQYLVEKMPVVNSLSMSVFLQETPKAVPGRPANLFALGGAEYRGRALLTESTRALPKMGQDLPPLVGSLREVQTISNAWDGPHLLLTGAKANEAAVKRELGDYEYLHFAVHGLVDDQRPLESALALSRSEDDQENGYLQVWEIMEQISLRARLVVLSACETGLGLESSGEGIIGLSRAFRFAGAEQVLVSLWSINDRSTSILMQNLYRNIRKGDQPEVALQKAQVEMLSEYRTSGKSGYSHPFYWAPFVLNQ